MEFQFKGANCLTIQTKKAKIVIDDNLEDLGLKSIASKADIALFTSQYLYKNREAGEAFVIDGPGEYEISEVSVRGIAVKSHIDESEKSFIYRIAIGTTMICVFGHSTPDISDDVLEKIGMIDILVVPVGNSGYTLDASSAEKVIKKIDPKVVIPTHYADKAINYEVPQAPIDEFIKQMSVTPEKIDKLKIKGDLFSDNLTIYQLERS